MQFEAINNLVEVLSRAGIRHIIICPGSRNAAITIAFARHGGFVLQVITDERSAGFVALGIGQASRKAAVVVCTSGTAAANLAPAIIEAYFQQIPLLAITADRPPESVGQQDGQAIWQHALFGRHVKSFFSLPTLENHHDTLSYANRIANQAVLDCHNFPFGPVHLNVPIREPFYPETNEKLAFGPARLIEQTHGQPTLSKNDLHNLSNAFFGFEKILIAVGQYPSGPSEELINALQALAYYTHLPILADLSANLHRVDGLITQFEIFLPDMADKNGFSDDFKPDLLITLGQSFVSKKLKTWLRNARPAQHWHIWPYTAQPADTFLSLTRTICAQDYQLIEYLGQQAYFQSLKPNSYTQTWKSAQQNAVDKLQSAFAQLPFGELKATQTLMSVLPVHGLLHLGNSMPIRYAGYVGLDAQSRFVVCANRGTSGIDGTLSTAVGAALAKPDLLVFCILGDLSFFYDQNALWQNNIPPNLRIMVLNNHGGAIFGLINGPATQPEMSELFITHQTRNAESVAQLHQIAYKMASDESGLQVGIDWLVSGQNGPLLLEIQTDNVAQIDIFKQFKIKCL